MGLEFIDPLVIQERIENCARSVMIGMHWFCPETGRTPFF